MNVRSSLATATLLSVLFFVSPLTATADDTGSDAAHPDTTRRDSTHHDSSLFRVATWNLLNLFDNLDHPDRADEGTDPKSYWNLMLMAEAIDALDADILGVQEVENREILDRLNAHLSQPFPFVGLLEGNDGRGIDVGVLSRVPLDRAISYRHRDLGDGHQFARDFPVFRAWPTKDLPLEIGVVHLKSRRGEEAESDAWRRAEAQGIRRVIAEHRAAAPDVPFLVMGDFNDHRIAATLQPLFSQLTDCTTLCSLDDRTSYGFAGSREQIDFVLTTSDLAAKSAHIVHRRDRVSDHDAVVVDFEWPGEVQRQTGADSESWTDPHRSSVDATDLNALQDHLLEEVEATGVVVKVHHTRSGSAAVLNFADDYRSALTARAYSEAADAFPDFDSLVGKTVTVRGPVCFDRDVYRIQLTHSEQLSVIR